MIDTHQIPPQNIKSSDKKRLNNQNDDLIISTKTTNVIDSSQYKSIAQKLSFDSKQRLIQVLQQSNELIQKKMKRNQKLDQKTTSNLIPQQKIQILSNQQTLIQLIKEFIKEFIKQIIKFNVIYNDQKSDFLYKWKIIIDEIKYEHLLYKFNLIKQNKQNLKQFWQWQWTICIQLLKNKSFQKQKKILIFMQCKHIFKMQALQYHQQALQNKQNTMIQQAQKQQISDKMQQNLTLFEYHLITLRTIDNQLSLLRPQSFKPNFIKKSIQQIHNQNKSINNQFLLKRDQQIAQLIKSFKKNQLNKNNTRIFIEFLFDLLECIKNTSLNQDINNIKQKKSKLINKIKNYMKDNKTQDQQAGKRIFNKGVSSNQQNNYVTNKQVNTNNEVFNKNENKQKKNQLINDKNDIQNNLFTQQFSKTIKSLNKLQNQIKDQSAIIKSTNETQKLLNYFSPLKLNSIRLLYRASQNSFSLQNYQKICESQSNTLVICITNKNKIIGAYSPLSHLQLDNNANCSTYNDNQKSCQYSNSFLKTSFIFSLTQNKKFEMKDVLKVFKSGKNKNKQMMFLGNDQFKISQQSNVNNNSQFVINESQFNQKYESKDPDLYNRLNGNNDKYFTTKEWEVWKIQFEQ